MNHNKHLYDEIEAVRIRLKKDTPIYVEKRWNLIIELSKRLIVVFPNIFEK